MKKLIEVVEIETGKVIHQVDVSNKSQSSIDKVVMGMLRKIDTDKFFLREPEND